MRISLILAALSLTACSASLSAPQPAAPVVAMPLAAASVTPSLPPDTGDDLTPQGPVVGRFLAYDDFEHGTDLWQLSGGTPTARWHLLKAHSCTGDYVMHFGQDDQATFTGAAEDAYLTLAAPLALKGIPFPVLTYTVKGQAAPTTAQEMQPEIRHGQDGAWLPLGGPSQSRYDYGFTRYITMQAVTKDDVSLRFHVHLDPAAGTTSGMYLDDVGVVAVTPDGSP